MSMFDDGGMSNILAPLTHSLIKNIPPTPTAQILPGMDNPAMRLQTAANRGRTPMPAAGTGVKGPMGRDLYKTLMLKQAGIDESQRDYHQLARDPNVTPEMLEKLLKTYTPPPQEQHGPGSIEISRGTGPRAMGEQAIQDWMRRAAHQAGQGETVEAINGPAPAQSLGRAQMLAPPQEVRGFRVGNIAPPQQDQPHLTPQQQREQMAAEKEQRMAQHQQDTEDRAARREEEASKRASFHENKTVLDELEKQQKSLMEKDQTDPNVQKDLQAVQQQQMAVRQRMQGMVTPQQQGQPQLPTPPKQGHALDPQSAQHFLQAAGGDKNKARQLAQQAGWSF